MILPVTGWFSRWGYTVYKMTGIKKHYLQPPAKGISPPQKEKNNQLAWKLLYRRSRPWPRRGEQKKEN